MALDRKAPSPPTCSEAAVAIPVHVVNTTKSDAREAYEAAWPGRAGQRCAQRIQRTLLGGPAQVHHHGAAVHPLPVRGLRLRRQPGQPDDDRELRHCRQAQARGTPTPRLVTSADSSWSRVAVRFRSPRAPASATATPMPTSYAGPSTGSGMTVRAPARIRAMLDVIGSTRARSDAMPSKMNDVLASQAARKPAESRAGDCPSRISGAAWANEGATNRSANIQPPGSSMFAKQATTAMRPRTPARAHQRAQACPGGAGARLVAVHRPRHRGRGFRWRRRQPTGTGRSSWSARAPGAGRGVRRSVQRRPRPPRRLGGARELSRDAVIRVVLADDQRVVRAGLRTILEAQDDVEIAGEAGDGFAAVALAHAVAPDVVMMDIRMPVLDGIEATRRLTAENSQARVLVLTTYGLDEYVYDALRAGTAGFLIKTDPPESMVAAVRVVAAGDAMLGQRITRHLIERYVAGPPPRVQPPPALGTLTDRELEVLRQVASGRSNSEIAAALYIGEGTVKTHVARVLAKLNLRDRVQIVIYAYDHGLVGPRPA